MEYALFLVTSNFPLQLCENAVAHLEEQAGVKELKYFQVTVEFIVYVKHLIEHCKLVVELEFVSSNQTWYILQSMLQTGSCCKCYCSKCK